MTIVDIIQSAKTSKADEDAVRDLLPEVTLIKDENTRSIVCRAWAKAWRMGEWKKMEDCPYAPPHPVDAFCREYRSLETGHSLVAHSRSVALNAVAIAKNMRDVHKIDSDSDFLIAVSLLHDIHNLYEKRRDASGKVVGTRFAADYPKKFVLGRILTDLGLPMEMIYLVVMYTYHPPHVFLRRKQGSLKRIEGLIFWYADVASADALMYPTDHFTHLEKRRVFEL